MNLIGCKVRTVLFSYFIFAGLGVGTIIKYRCSIDCQAKVAHPKRKIELAACSVCDSLSKCEDISYNGQTYIICSTMCLKKFTEKDGISIGLFPFRMAVHFPILILIRIFCIFCVVIYSRQL